jgi:hypothetical protein
VEFFDGQVFELLDQGGPPQKGPPDPAPPNIICTLSAMPERPEPMWEMGPVETFVPGEMLTVLEGAMAFRDRCLDMPDPESIEDIEHWIGKPYEDELPDPLSVTLEELEKSHPKTEAERNRQICWKVVCELLADIAAGKISTIPDEWHSLPNRYAQRIRRADFLRWAKSRGGYGEVVSSLLSNEPHEPAGFEISATSRPARPGGGPPKQATQSVAISDARKRGRKPVKLDATVTKMRADLAEGRLTLETLDAKLEKELVGDYGVCRDTARKARTIVLKGS